jgi:Erythromycin esterase
MGSAPTMAPVECALDGVGDPALRESLRPSFSKAIIPGVTQTAVPERAKAAFRALSRQLASSIDHDAPEHARQCASIVTQSAAVFDALPRFPADHSIPPDTWRTISARDEAMANNALAVRAHAEGKSVLLFAHTSHILNAPMLGGRWSSQSRPPQSMGETLPRSVGSRYLAIAQIEPVTPPVDAPPDLVQLLHPKCKEPCMVAAETEKVTGSSCRR